MRWGIIAALVFCCGFCAADEIDLEAVRGTLDKAVDTYFEEIIELDKEITERIDKLIEMASNRGDLNAVDELERQREAYLRTGFMPEGRIHLVTRRKAEFGINRAKSRLDQAYEEAIEVLTKEGRFTDARRIRSERLNLEQKLSAAQPELQPTNIISQARERFDPIQKQTKERVVSSEMDNAELKKEAKQLLNSGSLSLSDGFKDWQEMFPMNSYQYSKEIRNWKNEDGVFESKARTLLLSDIPLNKPLQLSYEINRIKSDSQFSISIGIATKNGGPESSFLQFDHFDGRFRLNGEWINVNGTLDGWTKIDLIFSDPDGLKILVNNEPILVSDQSLCRNRITKKLHSVEWPIRPYLYAEGPAQYRHIRALVVNDVSAENVFEKKLGEIYTNSIGMKLRAIPPGQFLMQGTTKATITKPFYIGVYEVTQKEWKAVMGSLPENTKTEGDDMPAQGVSWNAATEFCQKLSNMPDEKASGCVYRLPTETEWEYSCRAGSNATYCFGEDETLLDAYAWHEDNSSGNPQLVGLKKPNAAGIYDMHGNVSEWVWDWMGAVPPQTVNYVGPSEGTLKVFRGGCWCGGKEHLKSGGRNGNPDLNFDRDHCGLRVVMTKN